MRDHLYGRKAELPGPELVTSSLPARVLPCETPLTRDMIQMDMTSVVADTGRMKRQIAPALLYPTLREGLMAHRGRGRARRCTYRIVRQADFN